MFLLFLFINEIILPYEFITQVNFFYHNLLTFHTRDRKNYQRNIAFLQHQRSGISVPL